MKKHSFITILLIVLMSMTGAKAFAYDISAKNTDGVTIYYIWTNNKTELAVSYGGYYRNSRSYSGNVVIPEYVKYGDETYKVTSINESAFYGCGGLTSVTIPNSVKTIGYQSFYDCGGLTSVNFPNSLIGIGENAFMGTAWYNNLPDGLIYAGKLAYIYKGDMPANTHITLENGTLGINYNAFSGCSGLTSVTIPNSVTSIGYSAFSGCSGLTSVTIPNSVTSIDNYAFSNCSGLATIVSEIKTPFEIGYNAENSTTLIVPAGTKADYQSTAGWNSFTNTVEAGEGGVVGSKFEIDKVYYTIGENNTTSPTSANKAISGGLVIPSQAEFNGKKYDVTSIGEYAFSYCSGLTSVTISNSVTSIGDCAFSGCSGLTSVIIPNSVTSIGESAFSSCSGLTSVTIPNSVTSIGYQAFIGCSGLTSVIIGSGVLSIGSDAFRYTNLKKTIWLTNTPPSGYKNASGAVNYVSNDQFNISNKVVYKSLSSYFDVDGIRYVPVSPSERTCDAIDCVYNETAANIAINSTVAYKGVTMNVKNLNQYLAYDNKHIKTLVLDIDGEVSCYAFANCSNIQSINLGQKVSAIGSYAFQGCSSFKTINIPDIVTVLNIGTFSGCTSLKEINIKPQMTNINSSIFENCTSLKRVIIDDSESTLTLGSNGSNPIFSSCPLDYVYIGRDISYQTSSSYGYSPFYRNTTLRAVKITDKETEISENEFYGCTKLQQVEIGDGVTTIGKWAFSGCQSLKYFAFGSHVENIGQEAFSDCTALVQITSKAKNAPTCGSQALEDINKWECKLNVPKGYLSVYQEADQWKDFWFMEEGDYIPPMKDDVNSDGKVNQDDLRDLVEYIMGNKPNGVTEESADVNGDKKVNVADVVTLTPQLK